MSAKPPQHAPIDLLESWSSIWGRSCPPPDLSTCRGWAKFESFQDHKKAAKK